MALLLSPSRLAAALLLLVLPGASLKTARPATPEEDQYIYQRHWWPLQAPPGHHPGKNPTRAELLKSQSFEPSYNAFWRSLPKYSAASPRLEKAQQAPYFKTAWQRQQGSERAQNEAMFVVHHKTGENLHTNIKKSLGGVIEFVDTFEPFPATCPPEGSKVIHMVRRPVNMIMSGYRYHQTRWGSETWSWGHRQTQDPACFQCDDEDHDAMFETCAFNCTYFELLNRVDELTGSRIEALSARHSITSMANYLASCHEMPNVLHISFDLLRTDYNQSAACLLRFLGLNTEHGLEQKLAKYMQTVTDPEHVTSGDFDDRSLKEQLRKHPAWGPDFAKVDVLMDTAFSYQAANYGCPERELQDR